MNEFSSDKLRALDDAAKTAGPGTKRFRTSLLKSELVARADEIIAMAEERERMLRILAVFERHYEANNCDGCEGSVSIPVSALRAAASFLSARRALREEKAT